MATASSSPADSRAADALDEFGEIARLFLPLTRGAPEALGLLDDAAAIPLPDGSLLVVTTDTVVQGVHTPMGEAPELIARKLLRVNLSDLAAKAAEPYGWFLNVAWPPDYDARARERFAEGLAQDAASFGLRLFGGDTVRTSGPLVATVTLLGKAPKNGFTPRAGAQPGDVLLVTGSIGDAGLGLELALGRSLDGLSDGRGEALLTRYRLPTPRLPMREPLRRHAAACADVSDGLLADAGRIGIASGVAVHIDLQAVPLSPAAQAWVSTQPEAVAARVRLATSGDDYELLCACRPHTVAAFVAAAADAGVPLTVVGRCSTGSGVTVTWGSDVVPVDRLGYVHR